MKRFLKILFPILILVVCWYFVAKEEDYQVSFTSEQSKSLIFQQILDWENYSGETESVIVTNDRQPYSEISQSFKIGDSSFLYQWELNSEKNNSTKVTAHITDLNHSFKQRLQVPFFKNDFVKRSVKNVEEVGKAIAIKGKQFKLGTIERTDYGGSYCAYLPVTSSTKQKASNMLATIAIIMEYLKGNDIELQGDPFLEVTSWDEGNDMIQFNFCFPISKGDSLPLHETIQFKETLPFKALKTTFNGNYRISHYAWFHLLEYAEREGLFVKKLPLEIFLNDPHSGGNPLDWQADIFLPLEEQ